LTITFDQNTVFNTSTDTVIATVYSNEPGNTTIQSAILLGNTLTFVIGGGVRGYDPNPTDVLSFTIERAVNPCCW
jgi:hypothetical protein